MLSTKENVIKYTNTDKENGVFSPAKLFSYQDWFSSRASQLKLLKEVVLEENCSLSYYK